jgi:hypothetical protein
MEPLFHSWVVCSVAAGKGNFVKAFIVVSALIIANACTLTAASAGERENEAALGAGSGLLVGGPVGAVAGGVIGYVAGPQIRRGMGMRHHRHHHYVYRDGHRYYR